MFNFNTRIAVIVLMLLLFTAVSAGVSWRASLVRDALLPATRSVFPWEPVPTSDNQLGGISTISVNESTESLDFDAEIIETAGWEWPYISLTLVFEKYFDPKNLLDWSKYSTLSFTVTCNPNNILSLHVFTFDDYVTRTDDFGSYRPSVGFSSCSEIPSDAELNLRHLETPEWWRKQHGGGLSDRDYTLDKVLSLAIVSSMQSPRNTPFNVKITGLTLHGRNWYYLYIAGALNCVVWGGFVFWCLKRRSQILIAETKHRIQQDRLLIAYQQLPKEAAPDKERNAVMHYIGTAYFNPDFSLEMAVSALGIGRVKINEILKSETGLTFSGYLNKLRLTEAARLLLEKDVSVAEIAYAVGYNNASYFNALFKKEYGYTPKYFKKYMADGVEQ